MAILALERTESAPKTASLTKRQAPEVLKGARIDLPAVFLDGRDRKRAISDLAKMDSVFRAGDDISEVHLLLSGAVAIKTLAPHDGFERITDVIRPGNVIGLDRLNGGTSHSSAVAVTESQIIGIPLPRLQTLIMEDQSLFQHFLGLFGDTEERYQDYRERIIYGSAEEKLAGALLDLANENGDISLSQKFISERSGTVRVTTNKKLHALEQRGIIALDEIEAPGRSNRIAITLVGRNDLEKLAAAPLTKGVVFLHTPAPTSHGEDPILVIDDGKPVLNMQEYETPSETEAENITEEQRWLRTFSQADVNLGTSILLLRLSALQTRRQIAKKARVDTHQISSYEHGGVIPEPDTLEKLISAYDLDKNGKIAQLLRLQRASMEPITQDYLQRKCSIKEVRVYLQIITGQSEDDLTIDPDSGFGKVIMHKALRPHIPVPDEILDQVLEEDYLVAGHIESAEPYPLSKRDETIIDDMEEIPTAGRRIKYLAKEHGISLTLLAEMSRIPYNTILDLRKRTPEANTIALLGRSLKYDPRHQIMRRLLNKAAEERKKKRSGDEANL